MKKAFGFLFILLLCVTAKGQGFKWINPEKDKSVIIQGQLWDDSFIGRYHRLPLYAKTSVREKVWELSNNASGLYISFTSNTKALNIRYSVKGKMTLNHMSAIGVSGVDLYALTTDNQWKWARGIYKTLRNDTVSVFFDTLDSYDVQEYRLYLPLYNTLNWFEIGIEEQAYFNPIKSDKKNIIVYGTSIAQGASASRVGMAWTALLGREINAPIVNLGFSANGRLEKELVDLIASKEASIYIIDCLPNLVAFTNEEVYQRLLYAWQTLRNQHPQTPIIFTEHAGATINLLNNGSQKEYQRVNRNFRKFIVENISGKDENVYVVSAGSINLGIDDTADGIHPSDMGMKKYADAYLKVIRGFSK